MADSVTADDEQQAMEDKTNSMKKQHTDENSKTTGYFKDQVDEETRDPMSFKLKV